MYILGISGHYRNAAAALLKEGQVIAAIEEEKLTRIKNIGISQCGGIPYEAIKYCLDTAGIEINDINYVTYDSKPRRLLNRQLSYGEKFIPAHTSDAGDHKVASENEFHDRMKTMHLIKQQFGKHSKAVAVDHQLAHAASSFYLSGFERATIMVLSGRGDYISIAIGVGEGRKIRLLRRIEFPHSLGLVYSRVTEYLGFKASGGEHNTQWLGATGEPEFISAFRDMIRVDSAGTPSIDTSYFSWGADLFTEKFYSRFGDCLGRRGQWFNGGVKAPSWTGMVEETTTHKHPLSTSGYRQNLAHSLQQRLEEVVLAMAESIRCEQGVNNLCLAGGVALNSLLVARLERESGYQQIFVQPAAGNAGCSLGSALFQWHNQLDLGRPEPLKHVFLGPAFSDQEIKPELDNCKLAYRYFISEEKLLDEIVNLLYQGNIMAWFQGRAEFGPRSLGARSILASPLQAYMKENLNLYVKHRETSRPFAASIPAERVGEFFEHSSPLSRFLLTVSRVRADKRHLIPAAWFADGMARVHTVSRETNPLFWRLLNKFEEKAGVPVLVNTSFNLFGEPIVCTPREAVRSFYCSGIDALVVNNFLLQK